MMIEYESCPFFSLFSLLSSKIFDQGADDVTPMASGLSEARVRSEEGEKHGSRC
jgi:hypothetical protein